MTDPIQIHSGHIAFMGGNELRLTGFHIDGYGAVDDEPIEAQLLGSIIRYLQMRREEVLTDPAYQIEIRAMTSPLPTDGDEK